MLIHINYLKLKFENEVNVNFHNRSVNETTLVINMKFVMGYSQN